MNAISELLYLAEQRSLILLELQFMKYKLFQHYNIKSLPFFFKNAH